MLNFYKRFPIVTQIAATILYLMVIFTIQKIATIKYTHFEASPYTQDLEKYTRIANSLSDGTFQSIGYCDQNTTKEDCRIYMSNMVYEVKDLIPQWETYSKIDLEKRGSFFYISPHYTYLPNSDILLIVLLCIYPLVISAFSSKSKVFLSAAVTVLIGFLILKYLVKGISLFGSCSDFCGMGYITIFPFILLVSLVFGLARAGKNELGSQSESEPKQI